ncbi:DUF6232 family protein [Actinoplanes flavus]|uniref:Uncharacterized protein n=1 Tax=Actinoplanes flavus TaxID=2820290 RepID=A0ABS3UJZ1_9ACTN|nr:DUF6232 family protein [Actinoplanes flavus]MBO3739104.1 hypothetical protein [Actinoplanes flavus]MBO3742892.1 hypothetical protein [Actinoplanes flavus]
MPVFYKGPRAVITEQIVEVSRESHRRFLVAEMTELHIVRFDPGPEGAGRQFLGVSALVAAVVAVPLVGPASGLLAVLVSGVLAVNALYWLRPRAGRWWQLRATYHGRVVEVFSSRDEREFTGFCRGLVRCLEFRRP